MAGRAISDPVERIVASALDANGIAYRRETENERKLDFYLPDQDVYIECKQFSTPRTADQIEGLTNVIVIQGTAAAQAFANLFDPSSRPRRSVLGMRAISKELAVMECCEGEPRRTARSRLLSLIARHPLVTGWAAVPCEPTKDMLMAARNALRNHIESFSENERRAMWGAPTSRGYTISMDLKHSLRYRAMLRTAPPLPTEDPA